MYKAFFLILCLLACMVAVVAQERAPQPHLPSPDVQRILDNIRAMTPEQRARLRELTLAWLDERHASEQRAIVTTNQPSLPPPATSVLGGFPDFTQDPNLLKYGALGPNFKYGSMGPIGKGQSAQQSTNAQPNPGIVFNLPKGFTHPRTLPTLPSASAASVATKRSQLGEITPDEKAFAARTRAGGTISPYNARLPAPNERDGPRAVNPRTGGVRYAILPNTQLYDSRGKRRGEIADSSVRLNFGGERKIKTPGRKVERAYYAWFVNLTTGKDASGLVLESSFKKKDKPDMPSLMAPRPPKAVRVPYTMTGGDFTSAPWGQNGVTFKVRSGSKSGGQNSTDYGLRPDDSVNLCYNVPGAHHGGSCFDTFKKDTTFYQECSVDPIPVHVYYPGGTAPQGHLTFLFGTVDTPTGPRRGWVPLEALTKKPGSSATCN